ncbi:120.7 kDa protein in NOF-FB transposable element, partial [Camponotus floridanus]
WHDIDCESVIYKSNSKVQRNYNTLRRRRWTNIIFELIYETAKLPCAFIFKRCKISETGIYATIYAKCPDCSSNFIGKVIIKPNGNTDVQMECRVTNFNADIKHTKKRPLSGQKRVEISQSLSTGALSATTWRRREATKIMNLYDSEPPHLYKATTLRKAKQERQDLDLQ